MTQTKHRRLCLLAVAAGLGMLASSACVIGPKHDDPDRPGVADTGVLYEDTSTPFDGLAADAPIAAESGPDGGVDDKCGDGGSGGDVADGCADAASDASDADADGSDAPEVTDGVTDGVTGG